MSSNRKIRLAISTCPNDTFAFHAILENRIDLRGIEFDIQLLDIQQLNDGLFARNFDVAKASFHAAILLSDDYLVLPAGAALGFGVGPLLLSATAGVSPSTSPAAITLCPGEHTTATLLFRLFFGMEATVRQALFSEIMPSLKTGQADFGVCIHEGRFTWEKEGLFRVEDLGELWERETASPLPLGGILANKTLPAATLSTVAELVKESIEFGNANRQETLVTMRKYAQEFADDVLFKHVDLYVNDWTLDLGEVGRSALDTLVSKAKEVGLVDFSKPELKVWR